MASITLQFVGSESWASRIIEAKGGGPYSHVDIVLPSGDLLGARDDEVGGQPSGVHIRTPGYDKWDIVTHIVMDVTDEQAKTFYDFAHAQLGKPYDQTAIIGFVFNRSWNEQDSWFCSELVMAAVERMNIFPHPLATPTNKIDPCTAFSICSLFGTVHQLG